MTSIRRRLFNLFLLTPALRPLSLLAASPQSPPLAVASTSLVADWVRTLLGSSVETVALIGPDRELHGFEPKPSHLSLLNRATVLLLLGLGVDAWIERHAQQRAPALPRHAVGNVLPLDRLFPISASSSPKGLKDTPFPSPFDPHYWLDPTRVAEALPALADFLSTHFPTLAPQIAERAQALEQKLRARTRFWQTCLAEISPERRVALVPHAAFSYFNETFQVELIGVDRVIPHGESSAKHLDELRRLVRERQIHFFFRESVGRSRLLEHLAARLGLTLGGVLYTEALAASPPGPTTYLALIDHNLHQLTTAWHRLNEHPRSTERAFCYPTDR